MRTDFCMDVSKGMVTGSEKKKNVFLSLGTDAEMKQPRPGWPVGCSQRVLCTLCQHCAVPSFAVSSALRSSVWWMRPSWWVWSTSCGFDFYFPWWLRTQNIFSCANWLFNNFLLEKVVNIDQMNKCWCVSSSFPLLPPSLSPSSFRLSSLLIFFLISHYVVRKLKELT